MHTVDTPGGHDLFTVWAKFDKLGLYAYDVSIKYKEASKMQDLQNWISRYLVECKYQKDLDPKTLKAYRIDLEQFSTLIARNSLELTREGLMEYITDLHQQYKPRTVKRKIASVKAFCSYLEFEELVSENCVRFNAGMYGWKRVKSKFMGKERKSGLCRLQIWMF